MSKKIFKPVFGSDPEFFASYTDGNEHRVLPPVVFRTDFGSDWEENGRHPVFARYDGTIVHEDGAAFEMSTPPSSDWKTMWDTLRDVRTAFGKDFLSKFDCTGELHALPAMKYDTEKWADRGPEFEMAVQFGCDPDYDAFNMKSQCKILDASKHPWRYGGGHIHASGIPDIEKYPLMAIESMIMTVGLAATAYSDVPELEHERLFLYGKPGKFRIQKYADGQVGVEYRTPSNRWTHSEALAEKVFTWATIGLTSLFQGRLMDELKKTIMEDVRDTILSVNQQRASELLAYIETRL